MKKLFVFMLSLFMLAMSGVVFAYDKTITLEWTPNTEPNMAGYLVFVRENDDVYDYSYPAKKITCTVDANSKCLTSPASGTNCTTDIKLTAEDGVITVFRLVARAYNTEDQESGNSNEVSYEIDRRPLPIVSNFVGSYDKATKIVTLSWKQDPGGRVLYWKVLMSSESGTGYTDLLKVDNTGQSDVTAQISITDVPANKTETRYFVIVGYAKFDIYSDNSAEVGVNIYNPTPPADVMNLRIPVQ